MAKKDVLAQIYVYVQGGSPFYPGSRRPRAMPVDECANVWPGCRPTRAWRRVPRALPVGLHRMVKSPVESMDGTSIGS